MLEIYEAIKCGQEALELYADLDSFNEWCIRNGLECNVKKCCFICFGKSRDIECHYTLGDQPLGRVNYVRDLSLIIDSKLTFKNHVEHVKLKVNKKISLIKRFTKKFRDVNSYESLYYS